MGTAGPTTDVRLYAAIAAASGVAVEMLITAIANRRESWDSPYYWTLGIPAMLATALACGFYARRNLVTIGYAPFFGQLIAMLLKTGVGSMLPLGIILMAIIGSSGVAAAYFGAALGKKFAAR
ncbi:MAG: hypothetical protein L0Z53_01540 [Acidobacteriales bacterium]|nr:hypothetical protein [Terriglobales bacterium]